MPCPSATPQSEAAKPTDKPYKLSDEKGLHLLVHPNGSKYWRLKYRFNGKEKTLALGVYPDIGLKDARAKRDAARKLLADGVDPGDTKKAQKADTVERAANSFEIICREWLVNKRSNVEEAQYKKALARLEKDVFPWMGGKPIAEITAPDVLAVLRRIDAAWRTLHRPQGKKRNQPVFPLRHRHRKSRPRSMPRPARRIPTPKETHFAAITEPAKVGELLRAIDGFSGTFVVKCALLLAPLLFVRPGELRKAQWAGFDLDKAEWRYFVTKTKTEHLVPLASQAVAILRELHALTGHGRYVFPGRDPQTANERGSHQCRPAPDGLRHQRRKSPGTASERWRGRSCMKNCTRNRK